MKNVLLYIWQLPQNLLGLILLLIYKTESRLTYKGVKVFFNKKFPSGISLGNYIILRKEPKNDYDYTWIDIYHEYGHHRQSLYLGWFYLPVIGLPSLLVTSGIAGPTPSGLTTKATNGTISSLGNTGPMSWAA